LQLRVTRRCRFGMICCLRLANVWKKQEMFVRREPYMNAVDLRSAASALFVSPGQLENAPLSGLDWKA